MTSAWQIMQWVTQFLDADGGDVRGRGFYSDPSARMAGGVGTPFLDTVLTDQGMVATLGLAVLFLGVALIYYATKYTSKAVDWMFRFICRLGIALILTIVIIAVLSALLPWVWAGCLSLLGLGSAESQPPFERDVDSEDMIYLYMNDGTLYPMPKWSEIGTRERTERQVDAQWGFLDRILGFKSWSKASGAGFWGTIFGFNGEEETAHIAKSVLNPATSDVAWGGAKLVGQFLLSICANVGKGTVRRVVDLAAVAASSLGDAAESLEEQ